MDAKYLAQLKEQHATLTRMLQEQQAHLKQPTSTGLRMTIEIYINILEDAQKTASSLILHLQSQSIRPQSRMEAHDDL